jgi:hypothetical protein
MASNKRPVIRLAAFAAIAAGTLLIGSAGSAATAERGCASFASQADAQNHYRQLGGSPAHPIGALDPDGDGVACEELDGPYAGYASVGYNHARDFLYGVAVMPEVGSQDAGEPPEYACMLGNRHFDDGPRRVNVYRVLPGPDKRILPRDGIAAGAHEASGRLLWKANRKVLLPGFYYAEFEARVRLRPHGANPCPAFRSRAVGLS